MELKPWARRGGSGVFINHDASRTTNDCYVCEIPAGQKLAPQSQLFEETVMVLSGHGKTTVKNFAAPRSSLSGAQVLYSQFLLTQYTNILIYQVQNQPVT